MLRIRQEQLDAFAEREAAAYVRRIVEHLRHTRPEVFRRRTVEEVESEVRGALDRAARSGMSDERAVASLVETLAADG